MARREGAARQPAIVGVGTSDFGALYREKGVVRDAYDLAARAFRDAVDDAGIDKDQVDALICARLPAYARMADILGLRHPHVAYSLDGSGRMSGVAIQQAAEMIRGGVATTVACVYGNNGRSAGARYGGEGGGPTVAYDAMYGMTSPGAYVSLMWRRYQHLYGAPDGALAPVAISNRRNASQNPAAVMRDTITEQEYLDSRYIAEPLRLYDYCIINDGAVVIIVTSAERGVSLRKRPVKIAASAATADLTNFYTSPDLFSTACRSVAAEVYKHSGLGPDEMDCLQVYDNFTPTVLFTLEGFGYCGEGEAWQWVADGRTHYDGPQPVNTSGGHTGESYMQGWGLLVEAVRQLRGEGGGRQVDGCETAHYMCASPIVSSHVFTVER